MDRHTIVEKLLGKAGESLAMEVIYEANEDLPREQHVVVQIVRQEIGPDTGLVWRRVASDCYPQALYRDP